MDILVNILALTVTMLACVFFCTCVCTCVCEYVCGLAEKYTSLVICISCLLQLNVVAYAQHVHMYVRIYVCVYKKRLLFAYICRYTLSQMHMSKYVCAFQWLTRPHIYSHIVVPFFVFAVSIACR